MEYPTRLEGMKVSASGLLERAAQVCDANHTTAVVYGFSLRELLSNLKEMADGFYQDDLDGVDEFLQLYVLDHMRLAGNDVGGTAKKE